MTLDPILIIDDEKDNLDALRRLLRGQYDITTTDSPYEALKLIQTKAFHVILSDQRMPEMTGVELLEKAKNVRPASVRILITGYTEIDSVIAAINRGNIYRYIAKPWDPEELKITLRQANESYQLRRDLELRNEELQRALADLERLENAKARFLSLVSHELNTPLTVLTAFVQLLSDTKNLPAEIQKAVTSLVRASDRFSEIVTEVLTYVRLESGAKLLYADVDLVAATTEALKAADAGVQKKKLTVDRAKLAPLTVRADGEKVRVAVRKLVEDAVARAPDKSTISVGNDGKNLWVWRGGAPVEAGALTALEFAGNPLHHGKSLGLGLAIARLVAEAHGGALDLQSDAKDGTRLTLRLS